MKKTVVPQHSESPLQEISRQEEQLSVAAGEAQRAFASLWLDVHTLGSVSREEWEAFSAKLARLREVLDRCESCVRLELPHFPHPWVEAEVCEGMYCKRHFCERYGPDLWYQLATDYAAGRHAERQVNYWYHGNEFTARLVADDRVTSACESCCVTTIR